MTVPTRQRLLAVTASLLLLLLLPLGGARADTEQELQEAIDEVRVLHEAAEASYQRHREAAAALAELTSQLAAAESAEQAKAAEVGESRRAVGRAARASYTNGGLEGSLLLLLDRDTVESTRSFNDLRRVADAALADLATQQRLAAELAEIRRTVAEQRLAAARASAESERLAQEAAAKLAEAERRQAELQERYEAELRELRERQEAEQRQALAEAQARLAAQAVGDTPPQAGAEDSQQAPAGPLPTNSSAARQAVVSWALSKVGTPYVLGAEGPHAYDCSSFVTAAYQRVGISVPSYTGAQVKRVVPVPLDQVQPGDLLFYFGKGAQHVAIAIGDGRMVHAVNPSKGVAINRLSDSWYRERFTTAGRLLPAA